jgi:hypothetical protein
LNAAAFIVCISAKNIERIFCTQIRLF